MGNVIMMLETKDVEMRQSLYEVIDEYFFQKKQPITVCNVAAWEYSKMQKQIMQNDCLNERVPWLADSEKRGYKMFREMITPIKGEDKLLISAYNEPQKIGSYTLDANGSISYDENGYQITNDPEAETRFSFSCLKVYTTETYGELIAHYYAIRNQKEEVKQKTKELIEAIGHNCKTCETPGCTIKAEGCGRWSRTIHYKDILEK